MAKTKKVFALAGLDGRVHYVGASVNPAGFLARARRPSSRGTLPPELEPVIDQVVVEVLQRSAKDPQAAVEKHRARLEAEGRIVGAEDVTPDPGRPREFSPAIAAALCAQLAAGASLRSIVASDPAMPARSTIHRWIQENAEFSDHYARARAMGEEELFEEMLEIADQEAVFIETEKGTVPVPADVQRDRLRIDTRKWVLGRMSKRWHERFLHTVEGGDEDRPLRVEKHLFLPPEVAARVRQEVQDALMSGAQPQGDAADGHEEEDLPEHPHAAAK